MPGRVLLVLACVVALAPAPAAPASAVPPPVASCDPLVVLLTAWGFEVEVVDVRQLVDPAVFPPSPRP